MKHGRGKRVALGTGIIAAVVVAATVWGMWPWISIWLRFEPLGPNAQGYPEYRHRRTGIVFVRLPGATFAMGAQKTDPNGPNYDPEALDDEGPVHEVKLRRFLIGKHEVTQGEWRKAMGPDSSRSSGDESRPVTDVSWEDIREFLEKTRLALPSEAQWEYACRAGTTAPFSGKLEDLGWFRDNSGNATLPVGTKAPNAFGLFDLHGNVWEWCDDVYDARFYGRPEAAGPDPVSTAGSEVLVIRGGSRFQGARDCRSSARFRFLPDGRLGLLGFRPAMPLP